MTLEAKVLGSVLPSALVLLGLACFVLSDRFIRKHMKRVMLITLALTAMMILADVMDYYTIHVWTAPTIRLITCTFGYLVRPVLIILFYSFVGGNRRYIPAWCLAGVNMLVYVVNLFVPIAFRIVINREGATAFQRAELGYTCHVSSAILLLNLFCLILHTFRRRKKHAVVPAACAVLLTAAAFLGGLLTQNEQLPVMYLTITTVICCIFIYIWFHLRIVEKYEDDLLAEQRVKIMVSQIQPHFLYNTLATIKALCRTDPEKAATVTEKFGAYLRDNLDSLNNDGLISIKEEIDHTRVYADIETVRFENIRVEYDLQDTGFSLPALTVQPIVENAIRHGVRIRNEGIVRVSTRRSNGAHVIVICDNGCGFDTEQENPGDGSHIGISNVRERIETMCGGTVTIESEEGKGTTVTIRIPETEKKA